MQRSGETSAHTSDFVRPLFNLFGNAALNMKHQYGSYPPNEEYRFIMENITVLRPSIANYIRPIYALVGMGWSVEYVPVSYGLTYKGIETILSHLELRSKVCFEFSQIQEVIAQLGNDEECALITDVGHLRSEQTREKHAIALFIRKKEAVFQIMSCDSEGCQDYAMTQFENMIPSGYKCQVFISKVDRQELYVTCNAYAIADCVAFHNGSKMIDKTLALNGFENEEQAGLFELTQLPEELLMSQMESQKQALDYQACLIEEVFKPIVRL